MAPHDEVRLGGARRRSALPSDLPRIRRLVSSRGRPPRGPRVGYNARHCERRDFGGLGPASHEASEIRGPLRSAGGVMRDIPFQSATELASQIRRKKIGCAELLELYLARVEKYNPTLNAIIATDLDAARQRARAADRALARKKPWGPLHGVPMTIKESYDVVGMPTTWGVPELKDHVPPRNALAVDRLLGAGVVLFGKTNVPLYLADWQSYNSIYGTTNNPWDLSRAPGGSSGRSAGARKISRSVSTSWRGPTR